MPTFVVSNNIEIFFTQNQRAFGANQDLIQGLAKTSLIDRVEITACSQKCRFIDQIRQVSTNHTCSPTSNSYEVDILGQRHIPCMNLQDCQTTIPIGPLNTHTTIEASRT